MYHIKSIEDVRQFIKAHPEHPISAAWGDMLFDNENFGQEYSFDEFAAEAEIQVCEGILSGYDLEQLFG